MELTLGIDLGTTSVTLLALEVPRGALLARQSFATPRLDQPGDVEAFWSLLVPHLRDLVQQLGPRVAGIVGVGVTGQQHGILGWHPGSATVRTPFFGWQDRRGEVTHPAGGTWVEEARRRVGDAPRRTGCLLRTGYGVVTLFTLGPNWPADCLALTLMDALVAFLTGEPARTEATCAASLGAWDLASGRWDRPTFDALGLSPSLFPEVVPAGTLLGGLRPEIANVCGLPSGLPVAVALGDNQASFLGSVRDDGSVLVNIGTGGQVAATADRFVADGEIECRPYFDGRTLLVSAGQTGGAAFATLVGFFRALAPERDWYTQLSHAAEGVSAGSDGLVCEPFFRGTRTEPGRRASFVGLSEANLTPGHLARAVLEGIARTLEMGRQRVVRLRERPSDRLVGAGNGLRANPLLARIVEQAFGQPLRFARHPEEAAVGAALSAAVGLGRFATFREAGNAVEYLG
jgi:sedoheptulokinase